MAIPTDDYTATKVQHDVSITDFPGAISIEFGFVSTGPTNEAIAVAAEAAMDAFVDALNTEIPALDASRTGSSWTGGRN